VAITFVGPASQTALAAPAEIACGGNLTIVTDAILNNATNEYQIVGNGPGLPTAKQTALANVPTVLTFVLPGPGEWTDLELLWSRGTAGGVSRFGFTVSCGATPGCDAFLPLTEDSVVGSFLDNTEMYWAPGEMIQPPKVATIGQTAWVLGVDASGMYYQIVWSCELVWVPVENMGPNYDDVWKGTPLPTTIVENGGAAGGGDE
jgi:hypothetical protein